MASKAKIQKLYRVNLKGMHEPVSVSYNSSYVVASNSDEAYQKVRDFLDFKDLGFSHDREMDSVELLADTEEHTDVRVRLFL